jgi:hypothetical protein
MPKDLAGLTNAAKRALERVPVRTRESNVTRSAWRMEVACDAGSGGITQLDDGIHRGDGFFLGWPQEQLAAVYEALLHDGETSDEPPFETLQLG